MNPLAAALLGGLIASGAALHRQDASPQRAERVAVSFQERPLDGAVQLGRSWGEKRRGAWRSALLVQRPIGWWFDGLWRREIEFAWWYSPAYVSARLGCLSEEEYWPAGELQQRWDRVREEMEGVVVFFVQLAGAPKVDPIEQDFEERARLEEVENCRFVLAADGKALSPISVDLVWREASRDRNLLKGFPWHQFAPGGTQLMGEFEATRRRPVLPIGDFHLSLYRVTFSAREVATASEASEMLSLRVLSRTKERRADFALTWSP